MPRKKKVIRGEGGVGTIPGRTGYQDHQMILKKKGQEKGLVLTAHPGIPAFGGF